MTMGSKKIKIPTQQRTNQAIKNTVNTVVKNISIIAIFVSIGLIALLYLGPEINLNTTLVFRLAVPSVVLAISLTIVYELWITNGRRSAYEEEEYQNLLKSYAVKSDGLHYPTLQEFLDYERDRRYLVEYDRLTRSLEREQNLLHKMVSNSSPTWRDRYDQWIVSRNVNKLIRAKETIRIYMPFEKSEEFDYLRYNLQDIVYKEYSPSDTKRHLTKARTKKYTGTFTFTIVGLNILSIGGSMGDLWVALIMTSLAVVALVYSVFQGFSVGYHNVKIISTGVYKTGNSFLDQAVAYCKRKTKDLYYKGTTEFREYLASVQVEDVPTPEVKVEDDIFTKARNEVTRTDLS